VHIPRVDTVKTYESVFNDKEIGHMIEERNSFRERPIKFPTDLPPIPNYCGCGGEITRSPQGYVCSSCGLVYKRT
jgi:hypothetical protein